MARKIVLIGLVLGITIPLGLLVLLALSTLWTYPHLLPETLGFSWFNYLATENPLLFQQIGISLLLGLGTVIITLTLGLLGGQVLGGSDFFGKRFLKILALSPLVIPMVSITMGIQLFFMPVGLYQNFVGVLLLHVVTALPYGLWLFSDSFEVQGYELEKQGRNLGAKPLWIWFKITLPSMKPTILTVAILAFSVSFGQYIVTLIAGGGKIQTLPLAMFPYIQRGEKGLGASYSLIYLILSAIVLLVFSLLLRSYYDKKRGSNDKY